MTGVAEWEHPDHGMVRVFFRWEPGGTDELRWVPFGFEVSLFTPDSEIRALERVLAGMRSESDIDRVSSVSALAEAEAGYVSEADNSLPW